MSRSISWSVVATVLLFTISCESEQAKEDRKREFDQQLRAIAEQAAQTRKREEVPLCLHAEQLTIEQLLFVPENPINREDVNTNRWIRIRARILFIMPGNSGHGSGWDVGIGSDERLPVVCTLWDRDQVAKLETGAMIVASAQMDGRRNGNHNGSMYLPNSEITPL